MVNKGTKSLIGVTLHASISWRSDSAERQIDFIATMYSRQPSFAIHLPSWVLVFSAVTLETFTLYVKVVECLYLTLNRIFLVYLNRDEIFLRNLIDINWNAVLFYQNMLLCLFLWTDKWILYLATRWKGGHYLVFRNGLAIFYEGKCNVIFGKCSLSYSQFSFWRKDIGSFPFSDVSPTTRT